MRWRLVLPTRVPWGSFARLERKVYEFLLQMRPRCGRLNLRDKLRCIHIHYRSDRHTIPEVAFSAGA